MNTKISVDKFSQSLLYLGTTRIPVYRFTKTRTEKYKNRNIYINI